MTTVDQSGGVTYLVVVNDEEQYSIWPSGTEVPAGWRPVGVTGTEDECVAYVDEVWQDIRPLSVRVALAGPAPVAKPAEDRLTRLVADVLGVEPAELTDATAAATEDRWTSLKHIELVTTLEDVFGVSFSHKEIRTMTSLAVIRKTLHDKESSR
jgi:MbtH protein